MNIGQEQGTVQDLSPYNEYKMENQTGLQLYNLTSLPTTTLSGRLVSIKDFYLTNK